MPNRERRYEGIARAIREVELLRCGPGEGVFRSVCITGGHKDLDCRVRLAPLAKVV